MCGISGYISKRECIANNAIKNTLDLMKRRGPDDQSFFKKNYQNKQIALLHSRLNIIDLKKRSNQPFYENEYILIFNGEIYNYLELRNYLKKKNYKFKTESDTEVLIKSYIEFGEKCVDHFVGMWAFAIWDSKKKKLFISRDNFGEKPLYYYIDNNGFYFGSEIKLIKSLCKIQFQKNKNQIYKNLFYGYKSLYKTNDTFYKNIYSLENSSNIIIDLNLKLKTKKYWKPKLKINNKIDIHEASKEVEHLLTESLKLRMRADVPIAFCLSGGIDSGLLASIAKKKLNKKISTFSIIDKDNRYNEELNVNAVIKDLKCKNNKIKINNHKNLFFERLRKLTKYHDAPISTLSYYIHSFLSEKISKNNYRIAISGTGADEIFTGYFDHFLLQLESIYKTSFFEKNLSYWKKFIKPLIRNKYLKNAYLYIDDPSNRNLVYENDYNLKQFAKKKKEFKFSEKNYCKELLRNRMMNELFDEVVPMILKHDDHNSMYYSVENRSPYLDKNLLNYALTLPPHLLISEGYQKKILREASLNILNNKVRTDRLKKGFNASISSILNLKNKENIDQIFNYDSEINEFIDLKKLKQTINFNNIPNYYSKLIFSIITTQFFLEDK